MGMFDQEDEQLDAFAQPGNIDFPDFEEDRPGLVKGISQLFEKGKSPRKGSPLKRKNSSICGPSHDDESGSEDI